MDSTLLQQNSRIICQQKSLVPSSATGCSEFVIFPISLEPLTDRSNKNHVQLHHLTLWLNTVTFTSLHHGTGLVEKSGQSVVDGALFGDLQGHHRARPRHQLCRPAGTRTDSE